MRVSPERSLVDFATWVLHPESERVRRWISQRSWSDIEASRAGAVKLQAEGRKPSDIEHGKSVHMAMGPTAKKVVVVPGQACVYMSACDQFLLAPAPTQYSTFNAGLHLLLSVHDVAMNSQKS